MAGDEVLLHEVSMDAMVQNRLDIRQPTATSRADRASA
jgi:hypothetical protein